MIDLHRHLEGSLRVATTVELADRYGLPLENPEDLLVAKGPLGGLVPFLAKVDAAPAMFRWPRDWVRATREAIADAADDGVEHLELRFSPRFISQQTGLAPEEVIDAVVDGVRFSSIEVDLIAIVLRDLGPLEGAAQVATILSRRDAFCAVDLAGNEAGVPAEDFAGAFATARDAGLHVTVHAGEAAGPESVWAAVKHLGAERIGHGIRSVEDTALLDHLADHRITLEVALTSNLHTSTASSYREHPIHGLLAAGVPVALCTDDPRASATTLSAEFRHARHDAGISDDQLARIHEQTRAALFRT